MEIKSRFLDLDLYSFFYDLVRQIPRGHVSTYGDLARALGDIRAARACGEMLAAEGHPEDMPCHRVVYTSGKIGNFSHNGGPAEKSHLLSEEGISIHGDTIEDPGRYRFTEFSTDYPLKNIIEEQNSMRSAYKESGTFDKGRVCAVDVSYSGRKGVGSCIIEDHGRKTVRSVMLEVKFPYIPGYLSYREFPFIRELCSGFQGIVLIDGNGLLHYRDMGLATFSGIALGIATIGIAKSLLTGKLSENYVEIDGFRKGYRINRNEYISSGNMISLQESIAFVRNKFGNSYPGLLREAHNACTRLSGKVALKK